MVASRRRCAVPGETRRTEYSAAGGGGVAIRHRILSAGLVLTLAGTALADAETYQAAFTKEVVEFANLNRLRYGLHRDVHADCYIPVTIATVILSDGSVRDVSIVKSSSVPIVDRYFVYIIEQAAPYQALADHYDPVPEEITVTQEFSLDVRLWSDGVRSERACEELGVGGDRPE